MNTHYLGGMEIPAFDGDATSPIADAVSGTSYTATAQDAPITSFTLTLGEYEGKLSYSTPRGEKEIAFVLGYNLLGVLDEPQYSGDTINTPKGEGYRCLASGGFESETVFVLWVQVIDDYFGNMKLTFDFTGGGAKLTGTKSAEYFLDEYKIKGLTYVEG